MRPTALALLLLAAPVAVPTALGQSPELEPPAESPAAPSLRGTQVLAALAGGGLALAGVAVALSGSDAGYETWIPAIVVGYTLGVGAGVAIEGNVGGRRGSPGAAVGGAVLGAIPGLLLIRITGGYGFFVTVPVGSIWLFNLTARPAGGP